MIPLTWKHVEARADADFVVAPDEWLSWLRSIGIGAQHVVAMFGATFLVPVLTGFPPSTTLLFSGVGTVLFLFITGNRLPSYLGSSFSMIAPVTAAVASHGGGSALGGLVAVGVVLIVIGLVVHVVGTHWIDVTLPPVVTGAIVALIGFNLAPAAKTNFEKGPLVGLVTLALLVAVLAFFRGIVGRLAIFVAVVAGYVLAYAENIGVMAATRIYSTAAYWVAAAVAIALSLCPKVGAAISAIPPGVLGGATVVLYGLVGVLGIRIWLTNGVDFGKPINQMTAAIPLIIGIADFTWHLGDLAFTGIALGSIAALVVYHGMRLLGARTTKTAEAPSPAQP